MIFLFGLTIFLKSNLRQSSIKTGEEFMRVKKFFLFVFIGSLVVFFVTLNFFSQGRAARNSSENFLMQSIAQKNQGTILTDQAIFQNEPYYDSIIIGILYVGDQFTDYHNEQNNYHQIYILKSQNPALEGRVGWVDQADTSL
jgi:hypothetical protein